MPRRHCVRLLFVYAAAVRFFAASDAWFNTRDRESVRLTYRQMAEPEQAASMNWAGSLAACDAGQTSPEFQELVLGRIKWFRAMAGVPANHLAFDPGLNAKAQQAALIASANGRINHQPESTDRCYTPEGAKAAAASNLCDSADPKDPGCIINFMEEKGDGNLHAGHRRWLLFPALQDLGLGAIPAAPDHSPAAALHVIPRARPPSTHTRDPWVAWPPRGYVPYPVIYKRWSFSYPQATFVSTRVAVTREPGKELEITLEPPMRGFGDNALVFNVANLDAGPGADVRFQVSIENVTTPAGPQSFSYEIIAFDPNSPSNIRSQR